MKVLLVTSAAPERSPFSTTEKLMPLGVGFLLAMLRQHGHEVDFIDNYLEPTGFPDNGYLEEHPVDFVGIHANTVCFQDTLRMVRRLDTLRRRGKWHGKIMVGGPHVSVAPQSLPSAVDFAVKGEGEQTILDIVEGRAQPGLIEGTKIAQLDTLPRPAYDILSRLPYQQRHMFEGKLPLFPMNTSRGCPFGCTFCSVKGVWGRTYRYFSAERVFDDVCYLQRDFGARTIYFREDHFTLNRERTLAFCELLLRHEHPIDWLCESRADVLDEEVIKQIAAAGCKVLYIGVESGSPRMLEFFKKNETLEDFERAFRLARQYDIKTYASFVVGAPTETEEELQMSLDFAERLQADWVGNNVFTGLPGSELYDYCLKNKEYSCIDANGLLYTRKHDEMVRRFYGPGAVWALSPCRKIGASQPEEYHASVPVTAPSYDQRYRQGYMADFGDLYETCRLAAVRQTLHSRRLFPVEPTIVVDIACGQGRYGPVIKEAFPTCRIIGVDISPVALELAMKRTPENHFIAAACESLSLADDVVDMIFSIETLEHVLDVRVTIQEWGRVLKPGGRFLFTTPCANKFSLEWFMVYFTGGLQPTEDGIGRFRRDEPAHLRRLNSRHIKELFAEAGLRVIHARFRTHFFTTVAHDFLLRWFQRSAYFMASLDWRLLRRFPNGASMVIVGEKMVI